MTLILIIGLSLIAVSGVLVLRSFALANADRRRTLDQIAVYGFRASAPVAREDRRRAQRPRGARDGDRREGARALRRACGRRRRVCARC